MHGEASHARVRARAFGAERALRAQSARLGCRFRRLQRVDDAEAA